MLFWANFESVKLEFFFLVIAKLIDNKQLIIFMVTCYATKLCFAIVVSSTVHVAT